MHPPTHTHTHTSPPPTPSNHHCCQEGELTHYGQRLEGCQARPCWDRVLGSSGLAARRQAVAAFNGGSRFRKRGLAALPTKFGISFTTKFLNQVRRVPL